MDQHGAVRPLEQLLLALLMVFAHRPPCRGRTRPLPADSWADRAYQVAGRHIRVPIRGRKLKRWQRRYNTTHAKIRCAGEQAVATLKGWRVLRKIRCSTNRIIDLVRADLMLICPGRRQDEIGSLDRWIGSGRSGGCRGVRSSGPGQSGSPTSAGAFRGCSSGAAPGRPSHSFALLVRRSERVGSTVGTVLRLSDREGRLS